MPASPRHSTRCDRHEARAGSVALLPRCLVRLSNGGSGPSRCDCSIIANCFDPKQSGVVSLSRSSSFGSTKNLMFVLVDVDALMRLSLETCLTGTHQSPSLTVSPESTFPSREHHTASCHVPNCSVLLAVVCCSQPLPDVFQPLPSNHPFPIVQPILSFQPVLSLFIPFPFPPFE